MSGLSSSSDIDEQIVTLLSKRNKTPKTVSWSDPEADLAAARARTKVLEARLRDLEAQHVGGAEEEATTSRNLSERSPLLGEQSTDSRSTNDQLVVVLAILGQILLTLIIVLAAGAALLTIVFEMPYPKGMLVMLLAWLVWQALNFVPMSPSA